MSGVIKTVPKAAFLESVQMICTITEDLRAPVADIASFIFTAKTNNPAFSREAAKALSQVVREHGGVATYQRGIERELEKMRAVNPQRQTAFGKPSTWAHPERAISRAGSAALIRERKSFLFESLTH